MNSIQVGAITTDMVIETVVSHAGSGVCAVARRWAGQGSGDSACLRRECADRD